jgi:hypothetical protein
MPSNPACHKRAVANTGKMAGGFDMFLVLGFHQNNINTATRAAHSQCGRRSLHLAATGFG